MALREDKERVKTSREELGKFFYGLSKTSFTVMVAGATVSLFTMSLNAVSYGVGLSSGIAMTIIFAMLGDRILKMK